MDKMLHEKFVEAIREKTGDQSRLAGELAELLFIKKEAVYRRLRGEVFFTFAEMTVVARKLDISIDRIAGLLSPYRSKLFNLHVEDYFDPQEIDYRMTSSYIEAIHTAAAQGDSEFGFATAILPLHFSLHHEPICHLYILKWMYLFGLQRVRRFSDIIFSERQKKLNAMYLQAIKEIKYTYFIWDERFLSYLLNDIRYFHNIRLLSDRDLVLLKKETEYFLDHLEKLAIQGAFNTGNKVEVYVSSLNFETTYFYLSARQTHISMISAFCVGAMTSLDREVCENTKQWMQALKRTSSLISCSADKERFSFFERQRKRISDFFSGI
jgi:hypothetical protein